MYCHFWRFRLSWRRKLLHQNWSTTPVARARFGGVVKKTSAWAGAPRPAVLKQLTRFFVFFAFLFELSSQRTCCKIISTNARDWKNTFLRAAEIERKIKWRRNLFRDFRRRKITKKEKFKKGNFRKIIIKNNQILIFFN